MSDFFSVNNIRILGFYTIKYILLKSNNEKHLWQQT